MIKILIINFILSFFSLNSHISELLLSFTIISQLIYIVIMTRKEGYNNIFFITEIQNQTLLILGFLFSIYFINYYTNDSILITDGLLLLKLFIIFFTFGIILLLRTGLWLQNINFSEFYNIVLIALLSLLLMIDTNDLLLFYLTMETQTLVFYILASINRGNIFSIEAGLKYFISGAFMSGIFLLGTVLIYGYFGTLNLSDIYQLLISSTESIKYKDSILELIYTGKMFDSSIVMMIINYEILHFLGQLINLSVIFFGFGLIIITILFKIAAFPFHFWMPDVYEGSPLSSTIVFTILPKISMLYFLIKFLYSIAIFASYFKIVLIIFGVASTLIGTLYALLQVRVKRLILYSSIAQIGFIVCGLGLQNNYGYSSVFFFTFIYLVTSLGIWGVLTIIYKSQQNNLRFNKGTFLMPLEISEFSDILLSNKMYFAIFSIIFFSIGGIPPFAGFISKYYILESLVLDSYIISASILVIISAISVYYYIRILKISFFESIFHKYDLLNNFKTSLNQSVSYSMYLSFPVMISIIILIFVFIESNFIFSIFQSIILKTFYI